MLSFDQLTRRGEARRLRELALATLVRYHGLAEPRLRLLAMHSFNTIFRIDSPEARSVLRVGDAVRIHATGVEDVEAAWLGSLAADGVSTLRNIAATNGSRWLMVTHGGVPEPRTCTRFSWVAGTELRSRIDHEAMIAAGRLLAQLHEHAVAVSPTTEIPAELHARQAIYFGDQDLVAGYRSVHGSLFVEATARVQQFIDGLWRSGATPHLLHGDFGPHNLLSWRGQLQPIDFQDLGLGFAVQDIGITISDMYRSTPEFVDPFLDGYGSVRQLPELSPDTMAIIRAGRSLNIMNLALLSPSSGIGGSLNTHTALLVDWMRSHG